MIDLQFFRTPAWVTESLLARISLEGCILEPCCGDGAISQVLLARGYLVESSDIMDRGYGKCQNFFLRTERADNIVTNPPYNNALNIAHMRSG
jgi:methylase of polypeptide subunit release factors